MIYLRCEVSDVVGWGHLKRCLALAEHLNAFTSTCFLLSEPDAAVVKAMHSVGSGYHVVPADITYAQEIAHYPEDSGAIIVDLGSRKNLEAPDRLRDYFIALDHHSYTIAMIDGLGEDSYRAPQTPRFKALIQPYWMQAEHHPAPNADHWFYGPDYTLLDSIYLNAYRKKRPGALRNVLVTFGGADPQANTLRCLKGLRDIAGITVRVIVGPSFAAAQTAQIEDMALQHGMTVVHSPEHLVEHYHWADIGLCGSGTSRYEACACGLPLLFTAIYPEHHALSQEFASYGTASYLGYSDSFTPKDWQNALISLQNDSKSAIDMLHAIETMQRPESGAQHLAKALTEVFST